ncbi:unnamed protein product [Sphagnum troendelagicum]|uniref:Hcy-binding domain-containing protein n=1 Tax=Sphagnum troendelagicum TaxID=128251 RepID=A0ABP0UDG8_9BRYO
MGLAVHKKSEPVIASEPFERLNELVKQAGGCVAIDGGFATQLERHGADINDSLWSALCLITMPELIRKVHREYLEAGARIISTASYQATIQGFQSKGFSKEEGEIFLCRSVEIACQERDLFWEEHQQQAQGQNVGPGKVQRALVAASIGSYGAYLADGSEYSGDYGPNMTIEKLKDFHRGRLLVLANAGADLLALETIPCKLETQALVELLTDEDVPIPAWISFNSKDGTNVVKGDSFDECVGLADKCKKIVAVGINCTPPRFIHDLICTVRKATLKPIVVYPNSGEQYDPSIKQWVESTGVSDTDFVSYVPEWRDAGAQLIGGCCRTTPTTIQAISNALHENLHLHTTM